MADTYDPKSVNINFGGTSIKDGIADGTFVSATRNVRTRSVRVGSDGGSTIMVNPDRSAAIQITYLAGSATNNKLEAMRQDEDAGVYKVGTLNIEYFDGGTAVFDQNAFIDGPPDVTFETGESTKTWTIICPRVTMQSRGTKAPPRIGGVGNV